MPCSTAKMLRLLCLALVALPLSSPSPAQAQWQRCASQDEVCRFEGQALVRYGAEGRYVFRVARNRVVCDVEAFGGDPAQGVVKQCDYSYDLNRRETSSSIPSRGWTYCASENEYCRVPGTARMRYGADNRYVYGTSLMVSRARPRSLAIQRTANTRPANTKPRDAATKT